MSSTLSRVEAELPPGFRFHPKDEELICDYLMKKVTTTCSTQNTPLLIDVDLNKCEPWDIPETACVGGKEWYFYSQRDRKYSTGLRTNRATSSGYWKATGKDKSVIKKGIVVGMRKTLVFYHGRAPKGRKTDWVMHEFRLQGTLQHPNISSLKEDWVLCRVFYKSGEAQAKQGIYYDDTISCSSSLPSLMDSYITFNQTHHLAPHHHHHHHQDHHDHDHDHDHDQDHDHDHHQQVPCFSILAPNQTLPNFSHVVDPIFPCGTPTPNYGGGGGASFDSERNVINYVLNHFNKMDHSFLSDVAFPTTTTMWNPY